MATETKDVIIKVKYELSGDDDLKQKTDEVSKGIDDLKSKATDSSNSFGIMDTKLGSMWNNIVSGVKKASVSFSTLKGAIASTGIGLLVIAVGALYEWFKKTETGSDLLTKGMKILGQVVKEGPMVVFNSLKLYVEALLIPMRVAIATFIHMKNVLSGKESFKEAITNIGKDVKAMGGEMKETAGKIGTSFDNIANKAGSLADKWDSLDDKRRDSAAKMAKLESEAADLRDQSADADLSAAEKAELLKKAKEKFNEINQYYINDKKQELALAQEELKLYPDSEEWITKIAALKAEVSKIETQGSKDSLKWTKQINTNEKKNAAESAALAKEAQKKRDEKRKELEDAAKAEVDRARSVQDELRSMEEEAIVNAITNEEDKQKKILEFQKEAYERSLSLRVLNGELTAEENTKLVEAYSKLYLEDIAAIDDKYNEDKIKKNKDTNDKIKQQDLDFAKEEQDLADEIYLNTFTNDEERWQAEFNLKRQREEEELQARVAAGELTEGQAQIIRDKYRALDKKTAEDHAKDIKTITEDQTKRSLASAADSLMKFSEVAGKQSKVGKALAIASTLINTYQSATAAYASMIHIPVVGPALGAAAAAAAIAMGLKNVAEIRKTEPEKKALGGWVNGNKHYNGGVPIEVEGGEYIVNARTMANPTLANIVESANASGNGGQSNSSFISESRVAEIAAQVVASIPVNIIESEMTTKQKEVEVRENRFIH